MTIATEGKEQALSRLEVLRAKAAALASQLDPQADEDAEEEALLAQMDRTAERIADAAIRKALLNLRRLEEEYAKAGRPFRPGVYRFGDGPARAAIIFRQMSGEELTDLRKAEPGEPTRVANHATLAGCVLWYPGIENVDAKATPEQKIVAFEAYMARQELLYPNIWGEVIARWAEHTEAGREETRGKA